MSRKKYNTGGRRGKTITLFVLTLVLGTIIAVRYYQAMHEPGVGEALVQTESTPRPSPVSVGEQDPEPGPAPLPMPEFHPYAVESTRPELMLKSADIMVHGQIAGSYEAAEPIDFGFGQSYDAGIAGITTFRGNNFRDGASFGRADISRGAFVDHWSVPSSAMTAPDGAFWSGHGWTGQPLIVTWPRETRAVMTNMHTWAREQEKLTEVVYAGMGGHVYFLELETGRATRDALNIGICFKGSGALDPRGYPLLYLGGGYNGSRGTSRAFIVSLINGEVLYEFGAGDSFAPRPWPMFDAAPLIDAETDQLIWAGENGVLYIMKLNTNYDRAAGTLSVSPEAVKWRYDSLRPYWLGFEASPAVWRGHAFLANNTGILICLDLNTLEPVWVQDLLDDSNCSPVLEIEDGHPYIYISTSFRAGWRAQAGSTAPVPIWKIDGVTGEVVWRTDYRCHTVPDVSGGVQGTIAVGKHGLSDLVFVPVSRTPNPSSGQLAALDKRTGEEVWAFDTLMYAWSSPVCVYDSEGRGYIIYSTAGGFMYLLDGLTGQVLDQMDLGSNIEASPAVFENTVVVGTRGQRIYGIKLG